MSEAKHSPLPWKFDKWLNVVDANGERVVLSGFAAALNLDPVAIANTEFLMGAQQLAHGQAELWRKFFEIYGNRKDQPTAAHAAGEGE